MGRLQEQYPFLTAPHVFAGAFILYALAQDITTSTTIWLCTLGGAYTFGASITDMRPYWKWILYVLTLCLIILWLLPKPLLINPNIAGCAVALGIAAALAYHFYWFVPIAALSLLALQSRGALLAAGALCIYRMPRLVALGITAIALCAIALITASTAERGESLLARFGIWQDTLNHLTLWGTGFGTFADRYRDFAIHTNMTAELAAHAYNDYLELVFECGVGAALLWIAIIAAFEHADPQSKLILIAFAVLSLSYFPFHIPILAHAFALTLGHLAARPALALATRPSYA